MNPDVARQLIRDRIEKGSLPRDRTIELWHAPGFGQTCDGCGLAITTTDWMCLICADDWRTIRAALGFARLRRPSYDRSLWALETWLDSWFGIGHVIVGMARQ